MRLLPSLLLSSSKFQTESALQKLPFLKGVRTMTANIVTEMGYATGLHREALIATAVVLFIFILIINLSLSLLNRRAEHAN